MLFEMGNNWFIEDYLSGYKIFQVTGKVKDKSGQETEKNAEFVHCYPSNLVNAVHKYARLVNADFKGTFEQCINKLNETVETACKITKLGEQK